MRASVSIRFRRFLAPLFALAFAATAHPQIARAAGSGITLSADSVRFFSDTYLLTAEGHVDLKMPDGTHLTGEAFTMDLRLNRFNIAGDVTLDNGATHLHGAGFADFLDFKRQYFLPVGAKPDRWTFLDADYTKPLLGRQQPGDAFELADPGAERPYNRTHYATIYPRTGVEFGAGSALVLLPLPAALPVTSYYVNYSSNPNFQQNGFSGGDYDATLPLYGNEHAIFAAHFRHDPLNRYYLSFDQHFVYGKSWAVVSVNPATVAQKQYNLIGVKQISPNVQVRGFEQFNTYQPGVLVFGSSRTAGNYANLQVTGALTRSFLQLNADQFNTSLIDQTYTPYDWHPADIKLSWIGTDKHLGGPYSPFNFSLRSSYGENYNGYGIGTFVNTPYKAIYDTQLAFRVYVANPVHIVKGQPFYLNASYDKSRDYYSLPHHLDQTDESISVSYAPTNVRNKLNAFVNYQIQNYGDFYGPFQNTAYAPAALGGYYSQDILAQLGAINYNGFATSRSVLGSMIYKASSATTLIASMQERHDYPVPVPDIYGFAPLTATVGFRSRVLPNILVDIRRSYYFNFSHQFGWQPQFSIQVSN
jgi:hypothetical protein